MRKKILIWIAAFCTPIMNAQHNSDFMQYMFNGLLVNPAYAGSSEALNVTTLYRNQWMGLPGAPTTAALSAHMPFKNKKINGGGILLNDRFGVYDHTQASLIYAYRVKFLSGQLALGLQGGISSYFADWNNINTTTVGDPNFQNSQVRKIMPEVGAGTFYHTNNFYFGLSAPNLVDPNITLYDKQLFILHTGGLIKLGDRVLVKPAVLLKHIKNSPLSANVSTTFYYKNYVGLGLGYTHQTSALAYVDLRVNDQFNVGYGYTYATTELKNYSNGSHEIMLRYLFRYKINGINPRYF
jgi:type IX secretion system PorP/SprF family membrane protein